MGQATANVENSGAEGAPPSADDLLSQLAGDEIDRLLSEADVDKPAANEPPVETVDEDFPRAAESTPSVAEADVAAQLDDLMGQLTSKDAAKAEAAPAPAAAPVATKESTPDPVAAAPAPITDPVVSESQIESVTPDESKALHESTEDETESTEPTEIEYAPVPIFLKPLEWMNAPLASLSEGARSALGKVAIVTLLNAIAVLAYVIVTKKHP